MFMVRIDAHFHVCVRASCTPTQWVRGPMVKPRQLLRRLNFQSTLSHSRPNAPEKSICASGISQVSRKW